MVERLDELIRDTGPLGIVVLFFAAALEYVFPPFPGDTVTLAGGVYAVRGKLSVPLVFAAITAGSICGALADYFIGRWISTRLENRKPGSRLDRLFSLDDLHGWEARFRERGAYYLIVNRFLPGIRAPIFVAAGVSRVPLGKVLLFGGLSSVLWNGLLFGVGFALGDNAERLEALVGTYSRVAGAAVLLVLLAVAVRFLMRRKDKVRP
ncbi:MAG: DedA family protein [Myxococcales bacterium]